MTDSALLGNRYYMREKLLIIKRIIFLIFLLVAGYLTGDTGTGLLLAGFSVFSLIFVLLFGGVEDTVYKMVTVRKNKGFDSQAAKIFHFGLSYALVLGALVAVIMWFGSLKLSELVFGYPIMQSILGFFGILFLLLGLYSVLRGYTKACGYEGILFITDIVESIILIVGGVFITRFFSAYGTKVAAVLKDDIYTNLNGTIGVMITLCISVFVSSLIMLVVILLYAGGRIVDTGRAVNVKKNFKRSFIKTCVLSRAENIFTVLAYFVSILMYVRKSHSLDLNAAPVFAEVGLVIYKLFVFVFVIIVPYMAYSNREKRKVKNDVAKEEHKTVRMRSLYYIKNTMFMILPATATMITLAKPIVGVFCSGLMNEGVVILRKGGILILLIALSICFKNILKGVGQELLFYAGQGISFVTMLVFLYSSLNVNTDISYVVLALVIYYLALDVITGFLAIRTVGLNIYDLGIRVGKPIGAVLLLVLIEAMIDKFMILSWPLFILTVAVGYVVYFVACGFLGCITIKDVNSLKGTITYYPAFITERFLGK